MKIFFRYLFMRLLQTFFLCLAGCTIIWIMADLYGNMDEFLDHKVNFLLIIRFYSLQIPKMLVQVLPATMLFSVLFTLLNLNRRSELVALQAGGMAPLWMFSPFFLFAAIWIGVLGYDLSGPAAESEVTRERLLKQVKGESSGKNVFLNLIYVDSVNHLVWMFGSLDAAQGKAKDVQLIQRDARGHDLVQYFAREGEWNGQFWKFTSLKKVIYDIDGNVQDQKIMDTLELPYVTTPPKQLSLIISQPDQLTLSQLSQYIKTSSQSPERMADYRTEWWYRVLYPFSILVLILFPLVQGARSDRRSAMAGVGMAILVLLGFIIFNGGFLAMGRHGRLPPFVAAIAVEAIFGVIGLYLLAITNGWWWQLHELWKQWYEADDVEEEKASL